jgi:hypothetical protein
MRLVGEPQHLRRHPGALERREELLALLRRAAPVGLAVHHERRGRDAVGGPDGAGGVMDLRSVVEPDAEEHPVEVGPDVGGAGERLPLEQAPLDDRARVPVGPGQHSGGHVAAVRPAHDPDPVGVGLGEACDGRVHHRLEVEGVDAVLRRPRPDDRPRPVPSATGRAAGVGPDDEIAGAGVDLELVEEGIAVLGGRAAVDAEQHRHAACGCRVQTIG